MSKVTLHTNNGDIALKLYDDKAPKACENFSTHAKNGYYDKVIFHRVIDRFMIQGGDPTGTGRGGKSIWGKTFEDEVRNGLSFDRKGLLAMANAGSLHQRQPVLHHPRGHRLAHGQAHHLRRGGGAAWTWWRRSPSATRAPATAP